MATRSHRGRAGVERAVMILGGLVGLVVTPSFSRAYFSAYGHSIGENPPSWLEADWWPVLVRGSDNVDTYNRHGIVFGVALIFATISFAGLLRRALSRGVVRQGWMIVVVGLLLVAVGALAEYGFSETAVGDLGFAAELLGFLVVVVGMVRLAHGLRRQAGIPVAATIAISLSGLGAVIAGTQRVAHIPSGQVFFFLIAIVAVGLTGLPSLFSRPAQSTET